MPRAFPFYLVSKSLVNETIVKSMKQLNSWEADGGMIFHSNFFGALLHTESKLNETAERLMAAWFSTATFLGLSYRCVNIPNLNIPNT